jgi:biopolymer transport protein ExbD
MTNSTKPKRKKPKGSAIVARPLRLSHDVSRSEEVRIEILPLIDVIFCILTFFILGAVGLSRQQAISLNLPKASTGSPQMREMLVVSLDDFGQVYVEKQAVTREQLLGAIQNYHQFNPKGLMVLNASRNSTYNEVIQVLDLLRQVGGERVALATLPGSTNPTNADAPGNGLNSWQQPLNPSNPLLPNLPKPNQQNYLPNTP